jgi:hypothetical protein
MTGMKIERAKRAIAQTPKFAGDEGLSPISRALPSSAKGSWGSAPLILATRQADAIATLRGL